MLFGYKRFVKLVLKTYLGPRGLYARWTAKRFLVMAVTIPVLFFGNLMHWLGFLLDDLFFPGYKNIEVKEPVFIFGVPRSGTTLLQRVLARDEENFSGFTLWESAVAPSIIEWKFWTAIGKLDAALGGLGRKLLGVIDRRMFRELSKIHPTSLFDQEEDEAVLFPAFASVMLIYPFPFPEDLEYLARFDVDVPEQEKTRIMAFYRTMIQRHLYTHGPEKHYMTKNTLATSKIRAIYDTFPDARIICSVRSPYNSIPSILSLADFYWRQYDDGGTTEDFRDQFMAVAHHLYTHPMAVLPEIPEDRQTVVRFNDLVKDVPAAVARLYERLELPMNDAFQEALAEEGQKSKGFKSKHAYSMDKYALTPEMILEYYREVFDHYDFPTEFTPPKT